MAPPSRGRDETGDEVLTRNLSLAIVCSVALLAGCATVPTAPRVTALPGSNKTFEQFQADNGACQFYAQQTVGGSTQAVNDAAASSAVAGTLIGALAGAAIGGAASGHAGTGAAIGAGTGLLVGSANGANAAGWSSYGLQRNYDSAYLQCMYAKGNQVPVPAGYRARAYPAYPPSPPPPYPPPPPGYPPPAYYTPPPAS
jgi:Glycine-zipper domain